GFAIRDSNDDLKAMVVTDEMGVDINEHVARGYIDFNFENLFLRAGLYNIQFTLSVNNTSQENHIDYMEKAFFLNVLQGDFFRVGKLNRIYPAVILPCTIE